MSNKEPRTNPEVISELLRDNILLLEYNLAKCQQALQGFVDRVDKGEAKSVRTYAIFKKVLEETK